MVLNGAYATGRAAETRAVRVSRGLFVLRYVSSKAGAAGPEVLIEARANPGLDIITPDASDVAYLGGPGDAIVVRSQHETSMTVQLRPRSADGSRDAQLVLERVSTSLPQVPLALDEAARPISALGGAGGIEILAHVARRGDVIAPAGEWICGPQLPMAIEGLEILWRDRPADVDILMGAVINARGLRALPARGTGNFVGTRGRASPIVGLNLSLVGPSAAHHVLHCEALFLGDRALSQTGSAIDLSGRTGVEPLVGLRLELRQAVQPAVAPAIQIREPAPAPAAAPQAAMAPPQFASVMPQITSITTPTAGSAGRVRVFRAAKPKPSLQQIS